MYRLFAAAILSALFFNLESYSQGRCIGERGDDQITIIYTNGIATSAVDAYLQLEEIRFGADDLLENLPEQVSVQYCLNHNRTDGIIADSLQILQQQQEQFGATDDGFITFQLFNYVHAALSEPEVRAIIAVTAGIVSRNPLQAALTAQRLNALQESLADASVAARDDLNIIMAQTLSRFESSIANGERVIAIAHSQGNLIVNDAAANLIQQDERVRQSLGTVGVGSPANVASQQLIEDRTGAQTDPFQNYVTANDDLAINGLRLFTSDVLEGNLDNAPTDGDDFRTPRVNHLFLPDYFSDFFDAETGMTRRLNSRREIDLIIANLVNTLVPLNDFDPVDPFADAIFAFSNQSLAISGDDFLLLVSGTFGTRVLRYNPQSPSTAETVFTDPLPNVITRITQSDNKFYLAIQNTPNTDNPDEVIRVFDSDDGDEWEFVDAISSVNNTSLPANILEIMLANEEDVAFSIEESSFNLGSLETIRWLSDRPDQEVTIDVFDRFALIGNALNRLTGTREELFLEQFFPQSRLTTELIDGAINRPLPTHTRFENGMFEYIIGRSYGVGDQFPVEEQTCDDTIDVGGPVQGRTLNERDQGFFLNFNSSRVPVFELFRWGNEPGCRIRRQIGVELPGGSRVLDSIFSGNTLLAIGTQGTIPSEFIPSIFQLDINTGNVAIIDLRDLL